MLAFVTTPMKWTPQPSEPRWEPQITFLDKLKGMALIAAFVAVLAAFAMAVEWWETTCSIAPTLPPLGTSSCRQAQVCDDWGNCRAQVCE
jgi:hypothetical protein